MAELQEAIALYRSITHVEVPKSTTSTPKEPPNNYFLGELNKTQDAAHSDGIPARVAKVFSDHLFFGDVLSRAESGYFSVRYDDGDVEDWDTNELKHGIEVCDAHAQRTEFSLFETYHIDPDNLQKQWDREGQLEPAIIDNCQTVTKFYLFLLERQRIYLRRKCFKGSDPSRWTNDKVFREYFFCNNYRELDRGTTFFHRHVLDLWSRFSSKGEKNRKDWLVQVLWASFCYRLVNKIESFKKKTDDESDQLSFGRIPTIGQWPKFKAHALKVQAKGLVFFTGAHQTCGFEKFFEQGDAVYNNQEKLLNVANWSADKRTCHRAISQEMPGCGDFLAWQILCDLQESNCLPKNKNDDFCVPGKGAKGERILCPISSDCRNDSNFSFHQQQLGFRRFSATQRIASPWVLLRIWPTSSSSCKTWESIASSRVPIIVWSFHVGMASTLLSRRLSMHSVSSPSISASNEVLRRGNDEESHGRT